MKRRSVLFTTLVLGFALSAVSLGLAAPGKSHTTKGPQAKGVAKAPRTDASIQECIQQKVAAAPKLKDEQISVVVENGAAKFTGNVKNSASKGGVVSIAKSCGSKHVTNDITVEHVKKQAAMPKAKSSAAKKPNK